MSNAIADYVRDLEAAGCSPKTIKIRRNLLRRLHDDLPYGLAWATGEQISEWFATRGRQWSRWTRWTYRSGIEAFYSWAIRVGWVEGHPTQGLARPDLPRCVARPCTDAELAELLCAPGAIGTAALLAAYEGLRCFEIANALREHVDQDLVLIPTAKGGDPQTVPTHPLVWESIRGRGPGPLVVGRLGGAFTPDSLSHKFSGWCDDHGMPDVTLHRLRHWCGTAVQRAQGNIRITQRVMRHRAVTSTEIYTQVTDPEAHAAVQLIPVVTSSRPLSGSTATPTKAA